jgi:UDP-N-acetylglucosamine acyltransferase
VPREAILELKEAFRTIYFQTGNIREVAAKALASGTFKSAEVRRFLEFVTAGTRGIARARRPAAGSEDGAA